MSEKVQPWVITYLRDGNEEQETHEAAVLSRGDVLHLHSWTPVRIDRVTKQARFGIGGEATATVIPSPHMR
jgi:hypothetical protein